MKRLLLTLGLLATLAAGCARGALSIGEGWSDKDQRRLQNLEERIDRLEARVDRLERR